METLLKMKKNEYKDEKEISPIASEHSHSKKDVHSHSNHGWMMLLAHIVPIGLIIFLPILGFTGAWTFILPIILMIGIHIWMMKDHLKKH